ncbi:MAG: GDP-mannose 4,6-dehydratase [bacterium]|nr:GDP-mannose 4,6-dehydratase [bacterium]
MKILITGGCGFLGSNMVKKIFNETSDKIVVVDNLSTGFKSNIEPLLCERVEFYELDICNSDIINCIKDWEIDYIYNFACPASPKYYLKHPIETWESSVFGIKNLLDAIKGTNIKLFHSSTSEVYGDAQTIPQNEEYWGNVNPIGVRACYDEGKRAAEALIYDYIREYNIDVRVARLFNTYGPNMSIEDGRIISNFVTQALTGKNITVHGNGMQTRSFCYVDDTINAIYKLMHLEKNPKKPVNIGNPQEKTVKEVALYVKDVLKSNSEIVYCEKMSDDPQKRRPNIERAKQLLDWEPMISYDAGMKKTIIYFSDKLK